MIALRHVTKRFGGRVALDDVSLTVEPGATHVLLGSGGAGPDPARQPPGAARAGLRRAAQGRHPRHPRRARGLRLRLGDHAAEPRPRRAAGNAHRSRAAARRPVRHRVPEGPGAAAGDGAGAPAVTRRGSIAAVGGVLMALLVCAAAAPAEPLRIRVGSKTFTESYILAEMVAQIVDETGEARAERRLGVGRTGIGFRCLGNGDIDIYPAYTGTIGQALLQEPPLASVQPTRDRLPARARA